MMQTMVESYSPMPRQMYIAKEGHPFIAIVLAIAVIFALFGIVPLLVLSLFIAAFIAFFFRNPERETPQGEGLIISPADGRVLKVDRNVVAPETGKTTTKVSIFMSVMNVHINRFPVTSRLKKICYYPGKFLVASFDKASEKNERNLMVLEDDRGREIVMVQIAGLIARRIICYLKEGDELERGNRFGLIRFGSRVDLYLEPHVEIEITPGDKVSGGSTVIGRYL